jgi:hypothetical protein
VWRAGLYYPDSEPLQSQSAMSYTIVSNKERIDKKMATFRRRMLWAGLLLVLLVVLVYLWQPLLVFMSIPIGFFFFFGVFALLRFRPYFECTVDNNKLHLKFRVSKEQRNGMRLSSLLSREERLAIYLNTVYGYESHSFFSKEQQLLCLLLRTNEGIVRTEPIPVEHLDETEKEKFYAYLDQLITGNKKALPLSTALQALLNSAN